MGLEPLEDCSQLYFWRGKVLFLTLRYQNRTPVHGFEGGIVFHRVPHYRRISLAESQYSTKTWSPLSNLRTYARSSHLQKELDETSERLYQPCLVDCRHVSAIGTSRLCASFRTPISGIVRFLRTLDIN